MWCPKCQIKSPTVAVGNDELICAQCNSEIATSVPKPKSSAVRKKSAVTKKQVTQSVADPKQNPEVAFVKPSPEQTVASAQAVVKAWTDSNRKWRADKAHLIGKDESEIEVEQKPAESTVVSSTPSHKVSGYHLILFGLFVFLVGHALTIWAFLAGHFGAWAIGSFCSVGGVTIAIVSVVQALRELQVQIARSASSPKPSVKKLRRVKRKRAAKR